MQNSGSTLLSAILILLTLTGQPAIAQNQLRAQISKIASKQNGKEQEIKDPVRLGYYGFFVTYGSFVADGLLDLITVRSLPMEVKHHGTRYLMMVERGSGRTTVFVEEGEVTVFTSGDSLLLIPMDAAQAVPGGALAKVWILLKTPLLSKLD
jgi:hypothetical protein